MIEVYFQSVVSWKVKNALHVQCLDCIFQIEEETMLFNRIYCKKYMMIAAFTCAFCAAFFIPEQAHAGYLDPGSGSTAVQWIIAGIAVAGRLKRRVFDTVSKIFGR